MSTSSLARLMACSKEYKMVGRSESGPLAAICTNLLPLPSKVDNSGKKEPLGCKLAFAQKFQSQKKRYCR
ncbi:hypothetical protein D9M68_578690 [compost metagenome]